MAEYVFNRMNITRNVSAEQVAVELDRIAAKHGAVRPAEVVEESKPEDAVLHESFEWDDRRAAELHRQWQARAIIRCVAIVSPQTVEPQPVYVHVPASDDQGPRYMQTQVVVQNPDMLKLAMRDVMSRLDAAGRSLEALQRAIDEAKQPKRAAVRVRKAAAALDQVRECLQGM
jgi:hypothetical protein